MFSLLIPTGDGKQQTMVIWIERREGGEDVGGWKEDEVAQWREEESISVSGECGPNKSATVGMKTHSHSTFSEVSGIR